MGFDSPQAAKIRQKGQKSHGFDSRRGHALKPYGLGVSDFLGQDLGQDFSDWVMSSKYFPIFSE